MNDKIQKQIDQFSKLPPVIYQVKLLLDSNPIDFHKIDTLLKPHKNILNETLNLGRATCYGTPQEITTLNELVNILGNEIVGQILMIASLKEYLSSELIHYGLEKNQLWEHCVCSALISQQLSTLANFHIEPFKAFLGGFLADVGKLILNPTIKEYEKIIQERLKQKTCLFDELEEELIGINHAQASSMLSQKWGWENSLTEAVANHHNPEETENNYELATLIHIASNLSITRGNGIGKEGLHYKLCSHAIERVGITINDIEKTFAETYPIINEAIL